MNITKNGVYKKKYTKQKQQTSCYHSNFCYFVLNSRHMNNTLKKKTNLSFENEHNYIYIISILKIKGKNEKKKYTKKL